MATEAGFERVLADLYKAALADVKWASAAALINDMIRTNGHSLVHGEACPVGEPEIYMARFFQGAERREDLEHLYFRDYCWRDEAIPRLQGLRDGDLVQKSDLYTDQEKKTSAAYNEFRRVNKSQNGLFMALDVLDGGGMVWSFCNSAERGGWGHDQIQAITRLAPHIRQFARIRRTMAEAEALGASLAELLENRRSGFIQLDPRGRILEANDQARGLLRQGGGLSDQGGFLNASMPGENDTLQRLLARALPPHGVQVSAGSMTIGRPNARTRLVVHVTPVAEREWDVRAHRVAALVLIVDPESRPRIDAVLVAKSLNLTPAQGRVATMVAAGRTARDIAAMTGRTEDTVRWHLKKIFRKQGISRQADLVRRVLSLDGLPALRRPQSSSRPPGGVAGDIRGSVPESRGEGR